MNLINETTLHEKENIQLWKKFEMHHKSRKKPFTWCVENNSIGTFNHPLMVNDVFCLSLIGMHVSPVCVVMQIMIIIFRFYIALYNTKMSLSALQMYLLPWASGFQACPHSMYAHSPLPGEHSSQALLDAQIYLSYGCLLTIIYIHMLSL